MTTKPMLSVERQLLERASRQLLDWECADDGEEVKRTFVELRSLLDKPAGQGSVVAWQYRVSAGPATGWSLWHDGKGEEFKKSYQVETRPLYAEQPAPVAHTMWSVMEAAGASKVYTVLTSNQCKALADALNGVKP